MIKIRTRNTTVTNLIEPIFLFSILFIVEKSLWFCICANLQIFSEFLQLMFDNIILH